MARVTNNEQASAVAMAVVDALEAAGYTPEEAIPGLILAVTVLAEVTADPEQALDEAAQQLADGPTESEAFQ